MLQQSHKTMFLHISI